MLFCLLFLLFLLHGLLDLLINSDDLLGWAGRILVWIRAGLPALLLRRGARVLAWRPLLFHELLFFAFLLFLVLTAVQLVITTGKFTFRLKSVLKDGFLSHQVLEDLFLNEGGRIERLLFLQNFNQALGKVRIKSVSPLARSFMDVSSTVTGILHNFRTQTNNGCQGSGWCLMWQKLVDIFKDLHATSHSGEYLASVRVEPWLQETHLKRFILSS